MKSYKTKNDRCIICESLKKVGLPGCDKHSFKYGRYKSAHQKVVENSPSQRFLNCWKELKEILPEHTDGQRYVIALWWCGQLPKSRYLQSIINSYLQKALL